MFSDKQSLVQGWAGTMGINNTASKIKQKLACRKMTIPYHKYTTGVSPGLVRLG